MLVHCLGDSHVCFFSGQDKICNDPYLFFRPERLGSYLAYSLGDTSHDAHRRLLSSVSKIQKEDYILFSFGEIDIRVHVVKQSHIQNRPIKDIISDIVDRYCVAIDYIKMEHPNLIIWCPVPTCNHYDESADISAENPYPHIGTPKQRNLANILFKEFLMSRYKGSIPIIDIYDELINEDYSSNGEYFMDGVHLSQAAMGIVLPKINDIVL